VQQVRDALDRNLQGGGQNVQVQAFGTPGSNQVMVRTPQLSGES